MFDKTEALKAFGLTEDIYDELLIKFIDHARRNLSQLEKFLDAEDIKQVQFIVHSLKGAAANLRVKEAQSIAVVLEDAVKNGRTQEIDDNLIKLKSYIEELHLEIKK